MALGGVGGAKGCGAGRSPVGASEARSGKRKSEPTMGQSNLEKPLKKVSQLAGSVQKKGLQQV